MSLTWHIVKKDVRQSATPVAVWIAFVAVTTVLWGRMPMRVEPQLSQLGAPGLVTAAISWTSGMAHFGLLLGWFHASIGGLLAASFLQQDPPAGTTNFWSTRPISSGRLLKAKLLGGLLLFIVLPVGVMAGVWFSFGFSPGAVVRLAVEFSAIQFLLVAVAMALAALTRNLGTFLFAVLGAFGWLMICSIVFRSSGVVHTGRDFTLKILLAVGPFLLLVGQFLAFKRRWGWWMYGALLVAVLLTRFGEVPGASHVARKFRAAVRPGPATTADDRRLSVRLGTVERDTPLLLQPTVTGPEIPGLVPAVTDVAFTILGRRTGIRPTWSLGPQWGGPAALRLLNASPSELPPTWDFTTHSADAEPEAAGTAFQAAGVDLSWVEPRELWTVPIAVGTRAGADADTTRIVGIGSGKGTVAILCRETDVHYGWDSWPNDGVVWEPSRYSLHADCYVVTDTGTGERVVATRWESDAVALHGVVVTTRMLRVTANIGTQGVADWLARHTLTKVRFFRRHDLHATFAAGALDDTLSVATGGRP